MNVRNWRESRSGNVFMADMSRYDIVSHDEQDTLASRASAGDMDAREKLIMSVARLAVKVARQWATPNLTEEDAIQAAMMGVVEAANRYEVGRGAFNSYAMHWILMRLRRASVSARRAVKLPGNPSRYGPEVGPYVRRFIGEHGQTPEPADLMERFGITSINAQHAIAVAVTDASLNAVIRSGGKNPMELQDTLADEGEQPDEAACCYLTSRRVARLMSCLEDRERDIICRRFGIGHDREYTLEEIGNDIGLSRERVRQLQDDALDRMIKTEKRKHLVKESRAIMKAYRHAL